ncbi:MAG: hypothetical protein NVSMB18_14790 [Acetobacteraceae bacterium]
MPGFSWRFIAPRDIGLFVRSARSDARLARMLATGTAPAAAFDELYAQAREYDPWGSESTRYRYQHYKYDSLIRLLPTARRYQRSLDIGCGTGLLTERLQARSNQVLGIDVSATAIARARERCRGNARLNFAQADLLNLDPTFEEGFDLVVVADVLYYLPQAAMTDEGLKGLVAGLARLLRPGGTLLVANHYFAGIDPDSRRSRRIHDALRWSQSTQLTSEHRRPFWLASLLARSLA